MSKEGIVKEGNSRWQGKLYHWSPCRFCVMACSIAFLYFLYQLTIVGGSGGESSIEIIACFVFAALLALVDLVLKWLFNLAALALWLLELIILGAIVLLYLT